MNNIVLLENNETGLRRLAAQRELYSIAKRFDGWNIFICIVLVVAFSILESLIDSHYAGLISIYYFIAFVLGFVMNHYKEKYTILAAKIQNLFDTTVFEIKWDHIIAEKLPDNSDIVRYGNNVTDNLKNWYPESISQVENDFAAVLLCQKINCTYDKKLRLRYRNSIALIGGVALLLIILFAVLYGHSFEMVLCSILLPIFPIANWMYIKWRCHNQSIHNLECLNETIDSCLQEPERLLRNTLEAIQNRIYLHRKISPPIFNFAYRIFRKKEEKQMVDFTEYYLEKQRKVAHKK